MTLSLRLLSLVFFAELIYSCEKAEQGDSLTKESHVNSMYLWHKQELVACWVDSSTASQKLQKAQQFMSQIVLSHYSLTTTGVHFVGFNDCQSTPEADVKIRWVNEMPMAAYANHNGRLQVAGFGVDGPEVHLNPSMIEEHAKVGIIGFEKYAAENLLHELGHIAGLFHEHEHKRSTCNLKSNELSTVPEGIVQEGEYDPLSIMNYCKLAALLEGKNDKDPALDINQVKLGLSQNDKTKLKTLYGSVSKSGRPITLSDSLDWNSIVSKQQTVPPQSNNNNQIPGTSASYHAERSHRCELAGGSKPDPKVYPRIYSNPPTDEFADNHSPCICPDGRVPVLMGPRAETCDGKKITEFKNTY